MYIQCIGTYQSAATEARASMIEVLTKSPSIGIPTKLFRLMMFAKQAMQLKTKDMTTTHNTHFSSASHSFASDFVVWATKEMAEKTDKAYQRGNRDGYSGGTPLRVLLVATCSVMVLYDDYLLVFIQIYGLQSKWLCRLFWFCELNPRKPIFECGGSASKKILYSKNVLVVLHSVPHSGKERHIKCHKLRGNIEEEIQRNQRLFLHCPARFSKIMRGNYDFLKKVLFGKVWNVVLLS